MTRRILVSAYACEPGKGSEQGVGWQWCLQLAQCAELYVITRANNQAAIEQGLPEALRGKVHFVYHDVQGWVARVKRKERRLYLYYLFWQLGAYRRAKQLARAVRFDYVVHLTFGSIWLPTWMHRLPIPFIWGPVGGGEAVPMTMLKALPVRSRLTQLLRTALIRTARINPIVTGPARRACALLLRTDDTARIFAPVPSDKKRVVLETAMSEQLLSDTAPGAHPQRGPGEALRVIYTGRLVGIKYIPAALHAVAIAKASGVAVNLVLVGDGPDRATLERLAANLGISGSVTFTGSLPHADVLGRLRESDVYLFPSLKEGGVWSLLEAMAAGLAVVCLKSSGMAVITDDTSAVRVDPTSPQAVIDAMGQSLIQLANDPARRLELGRCARRRVEEHFRWEHKGAFLQRLFEELERPAIS